MWKKLFQNISLILLAVVLGTSLLEMVARSLWHKKYNEWLETQLHGFDYVDYEREIIIPKPNVSITVAQYRKALEEHGKTLGLQYFEEMSRNVDLTDSLVLFNINRYGFKGPEIEIPKPDTIYRILTIGNSCTWGPSTDYYSYPRVMERELNATKTKKFEVVNAGVLGYNIERVLKRIEEFLMVEPDLVTIYLGWNRTISRADPNKNLFLYRVSSLYKIYYHFIVNRKDTGIDKNLKKKTYYTDNEPEVEKFRNYSFDYDIKDLEKLVNIIKENNPNTKIIIITLAGLFDRRVKPDSRALAIGYPIASTQNLYIYGLLTKMWNDELRTFAQKNNLGIVDFEEEVFQNFRPRSEYFGDSVHPNKKGYLKMGKFLANEIFKFTCFKQNQKQFHEFSSSNSIFF